MKRLGTNVGTVVFNDLYFLTKFDILFQIETLNLFVTFKEGVVGNKFLSKYQESAVKLC